MLTKIPNMLQYSVYIDDDILAMGARKPINRTICMTVVRPSDRP